MLIILDSRRADMDNLNNIVQLYYPLLPKKGGCMAITISFTPKSMSTAQYDECIRRLEQAGAGAPQGRHYHVCYGNENELRVLDIWESTERFDEFGKP